jgi:hypothetical protein
MTIADFFAIGRELRREVHERLRFVSHRYWGWWE